MSDSTAAVIGYIFAASAAVLAWAQHRQKLRAEATKGELERKQTEREARVSMVEVGQKVMADAVARMDLERERAEHECEQRIERIERECARREVDANRALAEATRRVDVLEVMVRELSAQVRDLGGIPLHYGPPQTGRTPT